MMGSVHNRLCIESSVTERSLTLSLNREKKTPVARATAHAARGAGRRAAGLLAGAVARSTVGVACRV